MLGQNLEGLIHNNSLNSFESFDSNRNFDLLIDVTRDSSSADNSTATRVSSSNYNCIFDPTKPDSSFGLPDNYLSGGFPDTMMMEALKELHTNNITDFLNYNQDNSE